MAAERAAFEASLFSGIVHGEGLGHAVVRIARETSITKFRGSSRGLLQSLIDDPIGAPLGRLGFAVFLTRDGLYESASEWFARAGEELAIELAAPEYVDTLFSVNETGHAESVATDVVAAGDGKEPVERLRLAKVLAKHRSLGLLETALAGLAADDAARAALNADEQAEITWMSDLLSNVHEPAQSVEGAVNIAVMDYKLLDKGRTSSNRGDYVQTLAAVSHLLRFTDVEFVGGGKLASYLEGLKGEVHADRTIPGIAAKVLPVALDRDYASGRAYPKDTWLICNGWFMHRAFKGPVDFPFPEEVNPIMISFHIQEPDVLSEDVVEALREYQPIGCRDWTTVYRLRDVGISAFFSGCVTTTVGQVLKPAKPSGTHRLADVEGRLRTTEYPSWHRETFIQIGPQVRDFDLVEGIEDAREMLNEYAPFNKVATLRLHCYLPARSMGLPVDFRPRNRADIRFEGLLDLSDEAFAAIRGGIESKLEVMLREILSGASREEVYATWRRITADDVAAAEEYCNNYPDHVPSAINVRDSVAKITATKLTMGETAPADAVNLAFALDKNLTKQFAVVLQSVVDHTSRPLVCHVLGRGLGHAYYERLHALFPQIQFDFYDLSGITYGEDVALLSHISVSTMDRPVPAGAASRLRQGGLPRH